MEFTSGIREGGTVTTEKNKTLIQEELSDLEDQDRINWMKFRRIGVQVHASRSC